MRLVYMGSPQAVIKPLDVLLGDARHQVVGVVSQPAKPVGRGGKMADPPLAAFAKERGLSVLQPKSARDAAFLEHLSRLEPDVIVTAAYGQILSRDFLAIPKRGTINIHPSLLPRYRGAIPVAAALLDGVRDSGVTILFTVEKLDAGNVIVQKNFDLGIDRTTGELTEWLFSESSPLLLDALDKLADPGFVGQQQDESRVVHCRKIKKEDGLVRWGEPRSAVVNRFRAFSPWPGSFTFMDGKRVSILEIDVPATLAAAPSAGDPGAVQYDKPSKAVKVAAGDGWVIVRKLQAAGGKALAAPDFWNGLRVRENVRFTEHGAV